MIEMKKVFLVAICMLLCSCYRGNLIDKIVVSHVEKEGVGCYIDMAEVLDFQWDSLFYFSIGCSFNMANKDSKTRVTKTLRSARV